MKSEIVEIFKHKNRLCVIKKVNFEKDASFTEKVKTLLKKIFDKNETETKFKSMTLPFHNGYVSVLDKNKDKHYTKFSKKLKSEDITFSGYVEGSKILNLKDKWFLGFDTAHYYNSLYPETKSKDYVRKKTIELAEEMIKKKI